MESSGHSGVLASQRFFFINMDYTPDTSHGGHRCLLDSLNKSGLFPYVATMMVVRAVPHGPWGEDQRFRQSQDALADHLENTDPSQCPLFQMLAVPMLRDKGWEDMAGSDDVEETLWGLLTEASPFKAKGCKGSMNRFMSVVRELRQLDKDWHTTLYGWQLCSLELDFFKGAKFLDLLSKLNLGELLQTDVDQAAGASLRLPSAAEKAVKVAGCNAIVSGVVFLMEEHNQNIGRVILAICESQDKWHSHQNKTLRSCAESKDWLYEQVAKSQFMISLFDTWAKLEDPVALQYCGFVTTPVIPGEELHENHPMVVQQNQLAAAMGNLAKELVLSRLKKFMWMLMGPMLKLCQAHQ